MQNYLGQTTQGSTLRLPAQIFILFTNKAGHVG